MAEKKETKTNRDRMRERMMSKYPDMNMEDEETMFGRIGEDMDESGRQLDEYRNREKAFSDLFLNNPQASEMMIDMRDGRDPIVELVRRYGSDFVASLQDPDKQEELAKANKEYADKVANHSKFLDEYQKNIDGTIEMLNKMEADGKYDAKTLDGAMELLLKIVKEGEIGKFSSDVVEMAVKAVNHDSDVANAGEEGMVAGKNARYEEKLRKARQGDGTPSLAGRNGGAGGTDKAPALGVLDGYGDNNKNIWERGGEKRSRR